MIIRCCFPCLHISDLRMKIHDHREINLSLRTYMIELWISAVECWISINDHGYPLSFAFGFPCIPIYWLYQDCYLFITWSKWFAWVKIKCLHSYIYMGWNTDIQPSYALRNRKEKILYTKYFVHSYAVHVVHIFIWDGTLIFNIVMHQEIVKKKYFIPSTLYAHIP